MKTNIPILLILLLSLVTPNLFAGGCAPSSTNPSCAGATTLTVGAACINGTTCSGGVQSASTCLYAGSQCSWYRFTATATAMYVNIDVLATSGCHISSNIYSGTCVSLTQISCQSGTPLDDLHNLTGLTIGNTYFIQVCYAPGGPCGNDGEATYCIEVGEPTPPCNTCSTPCGTAQGFPTAPTPATVTAGCTAANFKPELQPSSTNTFCNAFTANATSVNFNVIITSNCGSGNVTAFSWSLYNSPSCGAAIQTGTLSSLTFSGLTIGNNYVFCYTFTVPSTCTHTRHCPYFVGATALPINLLSFDAEVKNNSYVNLDWITESEINNDFFTIERSKDGNIFEVVGIVDGAGNSSKVNTYDLKDNNPYKGSSYYRLKQTDYDLNASYSKLVAVKIESAYEDVSLFPNPVKGNSFLTFNSSYSSETIVEIYDVAGRKVYKTNITSQKGENRVNLSTEKLNAGMYFLTVNNGEDKTNLKFIKD